MADNYITLQEEKGGINVIISLVNKVVNEIDGVAGLATTAGSELAELIGIKNVNKGTKVQIKEDSFIVDVLILVKYHYNLVDVAVSIVCQGSGFYFIFIAVVFFDAANKSVVCCFVVFVNKVVMPWLKGYL